MSRTYLISGNFLNNKDFTENQIKDFFYKWCTKKQVYVLDITRKDTSFTCEMGCSGGYHAADAIYELRHDLELKGATEVGIDCWSLHPDVAICGSFNQDKQEQDYDVEHEMHQVVAKMHDRLGTFK